MLHLLHLPDELWSRVLHYVDDNSVTAFALACKALRRVQRASKRVLRTNPRRLPAARVSFSEDWCLWCALLPEESSSSALFLARAAAYFGHLLVVRSLPRSRSDSEATAFAALGGHLDVLRYLHEHGCPWDKLTCQYAAQGGHLEVLRYAHEHGCPLDVHACNLAAQHSNLDVLKYLMEEAGCPYQQGYICTPAALGGDLEVLIYLRQGWGEAWDEVTCAAAAHGGHLRLLRYLRKEGCPWDGLTCFHAAANGRLDVLNCTRAKTGAHWIERDLWRQRARRATRTWSGTFL